DDWNLDFTSPGSYDIIYDHIQGHKYFISRNSGTDTDFPAAVLSWYTNVYRPVLDVVSSARLIKRFPGRTAGDLYIWIIRKWDELKQKYGVEYPLTEVPKELENDRGKQGFLGKLKNLFKRKRFS
ncbi:MAG: transcriptional regulator, partial [Spirochaetes bacterium]|nr:transcriptional regulator [Candidatus Avitreponema avistercoris]